MKQIATTETYTGVPYLELIPIIRDLASLQTKDQTTTSFFLFIKPVIIRDDQFAELKYLSAKDIRKSGAPGRFPLSAPLMYRCVDSDDLTDLLDDGGVWGEPLPIRP